MRLAHKIARFEILRDDLIMCMRNAKLNGEETRHEEMREELEMVDHRLTLLKS